MGLGKCQLLPFADAAPPPRGSGFDITATDLDFLNIVLLSSAAAAAAAASESPPPGRSAASAPGLLLLSLLNRPKNDGVLCGDSAGRWCGPSPSPTPRPMSASKSLTNFDLDRKKETATERDRRNEGSESSTPTHGMVRPPTMACQEYVRDTYGAAGGLRCTVAATGAARMVNQEGIQRPAADMGWYPTP